MIRLFSIKISLPAYGSKVDMLPIAIPNTLAKICASVPDIIIVDAQDGAVKVTAMIPEILNQIKSAKVISLDLNSDEISIYRREGRVAHSGADLVAAIQERWMHKNE